MEVKYHGQSCFEIKTGKHTLLFDPYITPNPLVENKDISGLNPDYILITHGHNDHIFDAEAIAKNANATIITNHEISLWYQEKGVESVHGMNIGGKFEFDFGMVEMVNALHSSSLPGGRYGGNPAGFVVKTAEMAFYHAGDTGLFQEMNQIGQEFELNFAILPIGDNFTMGIDDALIAAKMVKCDRVVAMHFDTFPVIKIDHEVCKSKALNKGVKLIIPQIGESLKF